MKHLIFYDAHLSPKTITLSARLLAKDLLLDCDILLLPNQLNIMSSTRPSDGKGGPYGDSGRYSPPPGYSPPGQYPPVQNNKAPSAPPPPPGLINSSAASGDTIQQQPQPMIIYSNPSAPQFGPYPMRFTCPNCNAHVMTETHSTPGLLTWILSGAICCLAGYLLCCCLVPCCVRECKDVEHVCPNCQHKLGLFKRI